ncbi:MAG: ankyrin repeat domain-containing protein [Flavobacterium sp.]
MRNTTLIILVFLFQSIGFSQNEKSIFDIARFGSVEELMNAYQKNPNVLSQTDSNGFSALILATYRNNQPIALKLIELDMELNYNSSMGSALMASVYKNNQVVFDALLKKQVDLNAVDNQSNTALMLAVITQNQYMVEKLLEKGASKSTINKDQKNAFMLALETNNKKIIELFDRY